MQFFPFIHHLERKGIFVLDDAADEAPVGCAHFRGPITLAQAFVGLGDVFLQFGDVFLFPDATEIWPEPAALPAEHMTAAAAGGSKEQRPARARISGDLFFGTGTAQRAQPGEDSAAVIFLHREGGHLGARDTGEDVLQDGRVGRAPPPAAGG